MKNENGITLVALIITILLMIILTYVGIQSGGGSLQGVELQNFSYQMQQIQGRVDAIHEKMVTEKEPDFVNLNKTPLGIDMTSASTDAIKLLKELKGIDYSTGGNTSDKNYYANRRRNIYLLQILYKR